MSMDAAKLLEDVTGRVRAALDEAEEKAREIVSGAEKDATSIRGEGRGRGDEDPRARRDGGAGASDAGSRGPVERRGSIGGSPSSEIGPGPVEVPEPMPPTEPEPMPPAEPEPTPPAEPEPLPPEPEIEPPAPAQPDRESPRLSRTVRPAERSHDATAARIVAMKMALDGASRDEIPAHLDENYEIDGTDKLLDDVMARAKR